ncbi:N-alpha-acetyltransferase 60 isoform X2 [Lethenteron reissneri]|uniref:N-alpha-acetyltransferase 60 isoform X2 n=1 Tax=Lethenteron reissneri TaxID=7753 RepID=UPI002AB73477|nr:N-alpha-acetyltransferase 60 isoform X2 [Lethenteron reissneri]
MSTERADCGEVAGEVMLRFLCPGDVDAVKQLCSDWFPIEYPHSWYQDITSSARFFSLAATYAGTIIGMIVAEIKHRTKDADVLASSFPSDTQVTYILSLGVVKEFRSRGIGSLLLDSLMAHIEAATQDRCKAVYLHVLTTNAPAIRFYENRSFRQHHYLPCYYSIRGVLKDGFTYVLYLNGGHPPWTIVYPSPRRLCGGARDGGAAAVPGSSAMPGWLCRAAVPVALFLAVCCALLVVHRGYALLI